MHVGGDVGVDDVPVLSVWAVDDGAECVSHPGDGVGEVVFGDVFVVVGGVGVERQSLSQVQ